MSDIRSLKLNTQISEEAAEWFIEFRTGDLDATARRTFDAWVRSSPEHLRAYLEIAAIWNESDALDRAHKLDTETLMTRVRMEDTVVPLAERRGERAEDGGQANLAAERAVDATDRRVPTRPLGVTWLRPRAIAAATAFLVCAAGVLVWLALQSGPTYVAQVGEQRSIRLPDGSTVELNSRSQLKVRFSDEERRIELLEGQALFRVAKDVARPFIVRSDDTQVRAVGTQFDVYRKTSGTVVTVVEGKVAVDTGIALSEGDIVALFDRKIADSLPPPIVLSAGDQLRLTPKARPKPARVNTAAATAWTQRRLVLESASLAEVAEEFNRYSARKLLVEDSASTPLRLSGVFETDPDFLIRYLRERPDITVFETESQIRIVRQD